MTARRAMVGSSPLMNSRQRIVVIGAGTVGRHIAGLLQREDIDAVLIDNDRQRLEEAGELFDIQTLHGHGANPSMLERAGVRGADLVLAMTNSCEVNLLAAFNAKKMGARRVVVRSRAPWTMDTSRVDLRKSLDIDQLLNPEMLVALEVVKFLENPDALALATFAHGRVQLRQFVLDDASEFANHTLKDCRIPAGVLVVVRSRGDEVVIPMGDNVLVPGDKLTIIGLPDRLLEAQQLFRAPRESSRDIVIGGGGGCGRFLAQILEKRNFTVRLVEADEDQCHYLSERLPQTTVIRGDITRTGFLKEERIGSADALVAVTAEDEDNLMACLLARELGVKQTIARVNRPDYAPLVQKLGVDLALSPRNIMGDVVLGMVLGGRVRAVSLMEEGKVEVIEFSAQRGAPIVGKPLSDVDMPQGTIVSAIVHRGRVVVPRGDDLVRAGDTVVVAGLSKQMAAVETLFQAP